MLAHIRFVALFSVAACLVWTGCEEAVDPTLEDSAQFTLYGALDPEASSQALRVFPIRDRLEVPEPGPLEATVVSTDLQTGEEQVWRDSVVVLNSGGANVFVADFAPEYGHTYQIVVTGASGMPSSVVVDVPPLIEPILRVPTFGPEGAAQAVLWPGAARLNQARVTLNMISSDCQRYSYEIRGDNAAPLDFGWTVQVPFARVAQEVPSDLGVAANRLSILEVEVRAEVANRAWTPPSGEFDPEVLIEPGTFSNVTNGFGFVGAKYPSRVRWRPAAQLMSRAGFRPLAFGECSL